MLGIRRERRSRHYLAIESPLPRAPKDELAVPESIIIPSNAFPASYDPAARGQDDAPTKSLEQASVLATRNYFESHGYERASSTPSQHGYFDGSPPYKTPPTARRVDFGTIPQSLAEKAQSTAFGLFLGMSPRPSPSWEYIANSPASPLPSPTFHPLTNAPPQPPGPPSLVHVHVPMTQLLPQNPSTWTASTDD